MAHLALYNPNAKEAEALRTSLEANSIAITDFEELGTYAFADPNGVMIEIATNRPGSVGLWI